MFKSSILALSLLLTPVFIDAATHTAWAGTPPAQNSGVVFVPGNGNQFSLPPVTAVNATTFFGGQSISASLGSNILVITSGTGPTLTFSPDTATKVNTVSTGIFGKISTRMNGFFRTKASIVPSLFNNLTSEVSISIETLVPNTGTIRTNPSNFAKAFGQMSNASTANATTGAIYTIAVVVPASGANPGGTTTVTLTQSADIDSSQEQ